MVIIYDSDHTSAVVPDHGVIHNILKKSYKKTPKQKIQIHCSTNQLAVGVGWLYYRGFDIKYIGDDLDIVVLDQDLVKSDLIGDAKIKCSALCRDGGLDDWIDI